MEYEKKRARLTYLIYISIFTFFLVINFKTPLMGEDIVLSAFPKDYQWVNIAELIDVMARRIYEQMTGWNIRIGEQISIVFSCFDKTVFNILNSFMALAYIWLIKKYAFKNEKIQSDAVTFLLCFSIIILFQPVIGEIFFWRTGSTNYLWAICLLLGTALPLRYYIGYTSIDIIGDSILKNIGIVVCSFISGFTNENTVVVFIVLYVGVIFYNIIKKRKTPKWIYFASAALLMGFLCMYNAPSTKIRVSTYNNMYGISSMKLEDYLLRVGDVIRRFIADNCALIVLTIFVVILYYCICIFYKSTQETQITQLFRDGENLGLLFVSSISCGALIMSPYIETRAFLLADFFMTVCIIFYTERLFKKIHVVAKRLIGLVGGVGLSVACIHQGVTVYEEYDKYYDYTLLRDSAIELFTSEEDAFVWGGYQKDCYSRILTTREDYLLGNEVALNAYYGKEIRCLDDYVWYFELEDSVLHDAQGGIDWIQYDATTESLELGGWATLSSVSAEDCMRYIYVDIGGERLYFKTQVVERWDVAEYLGDEIYASSGFECRIDGITESLIEGDSSLEVGVIIVDRNFQRYNDQIIGVTVDVTS